MIRLVFSLFSVFNLHSLVGGDMVRRPSVSIGVLVFIASTGLACGFLDGEDEPVATPVATPVVVERTPNPGFDCAKARSWSSKTVCTDVGLADLDREMTGVYTARRKRMDKFQQDRFRAWQKEWKRNERDLCEHRPSRTAQIQCLKLAHSSQIAAIKKY